MEVERQLLELKNEDWRYILEVVTRLFHMRKYPDLSNDLPRINEKLMKISKTEIGQFIGEFYQNHILTKCMIILRQDVVEQRGHNLLQKLSDIWTQFYTSILPTLLAMFAPIQLKNLSVRALTLIGFRDMVLLKTDVADALRDHSDNSPSAKPQFRQMLLILQSVHRTPPTESFFILQSLVSRVVHPYLSMVARPRNAGARAPSEPLPEDLPRRSSRSDTVVDNSELAALRRSSSLQRRHSLGNIDETRNSMNDSV